MLITEVQILYGALLPEVQIPSHYTYKIITLYILIMNEDKIVKIFNDNEKVYKQ
jgi:hypothetical protein